MIKPRALRPSDTVAVVSPSWGGPAAFPHVYELGLRNLSRTLEVRVKEYPSARTSARALHENPRARADDINAAFADQEVSAIIASIGGDDSVRILPYLDPDVIRANPKILLGFSDTTTLLTYVNRLGIVTFHGPSVMAGWAQIESFPPGCVAQWQSVLCGTSPPLPFAAFAEYSNGYFDWQNPENAGMLKPLQANEEGFRWLQGSGVVHGELAGGCIEVLEFLKGTAFWPEPEFWRGKVLLFETSEDMPSPACVRDMLRNYGMQGILDRVHAIVFGRAHGYTPEMKRELEERIVSVVRDEFGRSDLPLLANFDVGHTDPQYILPLGVRAAIDCERREVLLLESATR